jgi:hypothetical protein
MDWTEQNIRAAKLAVEQLLNGLALQAYRFRVRPHGTEWEVSVEYPVSQGWKTALLRVGDVALLRSLQDERLQDTLAAGWLQQLSGARRSADRAAVLAIEARALGYAWAEERADQLRPRPAEEWPDFWQIADEGPLPADIPLRDRRDMQVRASAAARERWREIVADERTAAALEPDQEQAAAAAVRLQEQLEPSLPPGVAVGRDGQRVYLSDTVRGVERTIDSEQAAWRVLEDWGQSPEIAGPR